METINRSFKAAIFDMDGLILDSERTVLSCWEKIGEKYGFKDIVTYGISVIGKNKKATIDEFERTASPETATKESFGRSITALPKREKCRLSLTRLNFWNQ